VNLQEQQRWLQARLPAHLLAAPPDIMLYADEVVIVLQLAAEGLGAEASDEDRRHAEQRLIERRREETRPLRMRLARELQGMLDRPVAWGMRVGGSEALFTTRTVPVMTRLGRAERDVLDTLVAAGVADTRSAALAYTVRAFAAEHADWLDEVREAIEQVEQVRAKLKLTRRKGAPPSADVPDEAPSATKPT
jgi:hypothetical protein